MMKNFELLINCPNARTKYFLKIIFYFVIHIDIKVNFACLGDLGVFEREFIIVSLAINMFYSVVIAESTLQSNSIQ